MYIYWVWIRIQQPHVIGKHGMSHLQGSWNPFAWSSIETCKVGTLKTQKQIKAVSTLHHQCKNWASGDKPSTETEEKWYIFFFCVWGKPKIHYELLAGLEFLILLPQPPKCQDYKHYHTGLYHTSQRIVKEFLYQQVVHSRLSEPLSNLWTMSHMANVPFTSGPFFFELRICYQDNKKQYKLGMWKFHNFLILLIASNRIRTGVR